MDIPDFTGPVGGLLASSFITGFAGGWSICQHYFNKHVDELKGQILALDDKMMKQEEICMKRINAIQRRLAEVEDSRFDFASRSDAKP